MLNSYCCFSACLLVTECFVMTFFRCCSCHILYIHHSSINVERERSVICGIEYYVHFFSSFDTVFGFVINEIINLEKNRYFSIKLAEALCI